MLNQSRMGNEISVAPSKILTQPMRPTTNTHERPLPYSSYYQNTSNVHPRTGNILPNVNPLAEVTRLVRAGNQISVTSRAGQSFDPRGDIGHRAGIEVLTNDHHLVNPRRYDARKDDVFVHKVVNDLRTKPRHY